MHQPNKKVLGKLGPGQSGPGQLGPGQLGPGQLGPGARLSGAQLSVANWAPDSWAPGPNRPGPSCPGPNCPGPDCPGPNMPRTVLGTAKFCSSSLTWRISQYKDNIVFCCVCLLKYYLTFPVETAPHFYVNAICLQKRKLLTGEMKTSSQINISKVMFFPQSYF